MEWVKVGELFDSVGQNMKSYTCKKQVSKSNYPLREKCPNTDLFLVRIFLYSDLIWRDTEYLSAFCQNTGKYGPEITPYLDTFHAAIMMKNVVPVIYWQD